MNNYLLHCKLGINFLFSFGFIKIKEWAHILIKVPLEGDTAQKVACA